MAKQTVSMFATGVPCKELTCELIASNVNYGSSTECADRWPASVTAFIGSEGEDQLIPLLGCEIIMKHDCSLPIGLAISHDGRMYVCTQHMATGYNTLCVREVNGSESLLALRSEPYEEYTDQYLGCEQPQLCSDDAIVVYDDEYGLTKHSKDGEFIWKIKSETELSIALDSSDLLYCATSDQVKVYLPSGAFSHVLVSDLNGPMAIAIDGDGNIHVGLSSSIQVFSAKGKLIREYGHDELGKVLSIAISRDNPQLVVAAGRKEPVLLNTNNFMKLFVFNSTGSFLYTIMSVFYVYDITFGPDNSLFIAGEDFNEFGITIRIPKLFHQLPPPLSYLCELSILPHLNELPVSLLPPRLAGLFEKWTHLVTVEVRRKSFTDYPSKVMRISERIQLKVEPNASLEMVRWLVCKKLELEYSTTSICRIDDAEMFHCMK